MATFNLADLTAEEKQMLTMIRKRKAELLEEIEVKSFFSCRARPGPSCIANKGILG